MTDQPFEPSAYPPPPDLSALGQPLFIEQPKPVGSAGMAAAVLIGIATVLSAVDTWADWHRFNLVDAIESGSRPVTLDEARNADSISQATTWAALIALIAAGVVFLVWLWRARQNAERMCMAPHRRARGWVIGSWICPVVNFWFPFMIVDDVYRASRPDNPRDLADLRTVSGSVMLGWWWALWVAMWVTDRYVTVRLRGDDLSANNFYVIAMSGTIGTLALAGAAVLIIRIMREISAWQVPRWPS